MAVENMLIEININVTCKIEFSATSVDNLKSIEPIESVLIEQARSIVPWIASQTAIALERKLLGLSPGIVYLMEQVRRPLGAV
ncbi:hypothetical protein KGM_200175 [Danaus plexippus plexippus]|uniref:Uncharacterized protein n=1 Tax=Danaus plexippus plexippus TaxID=278856 RepID=A0A212F0F2_DANPL|nr:hypothetical protein KGM_200175 [Danaus plexippus plexippus]